MKLSGEMFQEIISRLTSDGAAGSHNKRLEPRVGIRAQGIITPWTLDQTAAKGLPITIRDLSPAGICILSATPLQRGARFVLQLRRAHGGPLMANYEVRYCKPLGGNLHSIGGKLANLSDSNGRNLAAA